MNIHALGDQIVSQLESRQQDFILCGSGLSGKQLPENHFEIGITFDAESYSSALIELLQLEIVKNSLTHEQAIELAAVCFSRALELSAEEAQALARESVTLE